MKCFWGLDQRYFLHSIIRSSYQKIIGKQSSFLQYGSIVFVRYVGLFYSPNIALDIRYVHTLQSNVDSKEILELTQPKYYLSQTAFKNVINKSKNINS